MAARWGMVGYGWVARDHMRLAITAAGHQLAAVADPSSAARARAEEDGVTAVAGVEELLEAGGCDMIYVATPNHRHAGPVRAAAAAGLPVLCEKPMAAALDDAEAMAKAVRVAGVLYGTAFDQRHHPAHCVMHERIAGGAVGRPIAVRIVYACWVDPLWSPTGEANWRADPTAAGGGAVIDLALHGLDLAQMLLGEPIERLQIMLQRRIHDYPVDDGGMLVGRTASGVLVSLHVAYNCAEVLPRRRLEVLGETGLLVATDTMGQSAGGRVTLRCTDTGVEYYLPFDDTRSPFAAQVEAFGRAADGEPHDFSLDRDLALMRLFDAAYGEAKACL